MENGSENNHGRNDDGKFQKTLLRLIFAAGGLILLFNGSFSMMQFEDRASLKGMFFIILSLGVGLFVFEPEECNNVLEKLRNMHFLVNAVVKFLLLGLFSAVIFFTKYPGLKIHLSEGKRSRKLYDLLGIGSFSVFALLISWERQHGEAGFGIFEFMLELTMDASMEVPAGHYDGSGPNLWYMVGAYVYCFLLLIIRAYGNSLSTEQGISNYVGPQEPLLQDQNVQPQDQNDAEDSDLDTIDCLLQGQKDAFCAIDDLFHSESETPLQDQNDQPIDLEEGGPGTDLNAIDLEEHGSGTDLGLDAIDLERRSEINHARLTNLGNYEVDGLRNRRSLQHQHDALKKALENEGPRPPVLPAVVPKCDLEKFESGSVSDFDLDTILDDQHYALDFDLDATLDQHRWINIQDSRLKHD